MTQKKAKIGRPKLPKGEAKGRVIQVRFTAPDTKAIEAAAKASKQTVSEWVRGTVMATGTFNAHCPHCEKDVTASTKLGRAALMEALAQDGDIRVIHLSVDGSGDHEWSLTRQQKHNLRNHIANGFI
ncbi:MAG: hypothetical protein WA252_07110 [Candidatus Sulfotelmatobacter sp.]